MKLVWSYIAEQLHDDPCRLVFHSMFHGLFFLAHLTNLRLAVAAAQMCPVWLARWIIAREAESLVKEHKAIWMAISELKRVFVNAVIRLYGDAGFQVFRSLASAKQLIAGASVQLHEVA